MRASVSGLTALLVLWLFPLNIFIHSFIVPNRLTYVHPCHSTRSLRLSNTNLLSAPFVRTSFGSRSFSVAAHKIWNSLPLSLRTCTSPDTFRRHLKTHYCQQAFLSSCASDSALLTIVRVYKLYLLTYL